MIINTVKNSIHLNLLLLLSLLGSSLVNAAFAPNGTTADADDYNAVPPSSTQTSPPMVMLALSNDHQLYFKSFSDYEDLDGKDGPEITYTHGFDYVGYFDPYKCYVYSTTDNRFNPSAVTADKYCTSGSSQWSGNFLNWATMTRIDQIRKVLYGGTRSTDSNSTTVLERSFLVNDAHSFAKYYNGTDIELLTPYNPTEQGVNTSTSGMTFCNTTYVASGASETISTATHPPLLRIVEGNYSLWAAGERYQCRFSDELAGGQGSNGNNVTVTTINASSSSPDVADKIADLNVRVSVCVDGLEEENCKAYPTSTHKKPTGLLHEFGDEDDVLFGLLTGSYNKNKSGGVLRKNIASWTNEVNVTTDGTFAAVPAGGGIVDTLDRFRLTSYQFSDGLYNNLDNCTFGLSSFSDGSCRNWGNPFGEIMEECYRYFAGATANTTDYVTDDSTLIPGLNTATWSNPQTNETRCAKLSVIAINASTISYDADTLSTKILTDLRVGGDPGDPMTAPALTDLVGNHEGINSNDYFVGELLSGGASANDTNQLCTGKTVGTLGDVAGTCPDSPRLGGSYFTAGLAYHAFTTDLRSDIDDEQFVDTYAISLAPVASADIPIPTTSNTITLLPACRNLRPNPDGNCAIVDFKILTLPTESGGIVTAKYYVNWEDSEQGGDFDQDMHGVIDVTVTTNTVTVATTIVGQSTPYELGFGYVIGGTTTDGFYAQSGINGYNESECSAGCNSSDATASKTFTIGTSTAELLEPPLFYAAKYGNFNDFSGDGTPQGSSATDYTEWDTKDQNGEPVEDGDGIPDAYFPVTNPASIQSSLSTVLNAIVEGQTSSSAAAVVGNSSDGTGAVYQAAYEATTSADVDGNSVNWTGSILSFFIDSDSRLREDACDPAINLLSSTTLCNKLLDDTDPEIRFNADVGDIDKDGDFTELVIDRYDPVTGLLVPVPPGGVLPDFSNSPQGAPIGSIELIWDVNENLSGISDVTTQRAYNSVASNGRYVFTWLDEDSDSAVDSAEVKEFTTATFTAIDAVDTTLDPRRYLGFETATDIADTDGVDLSDKLVNYIRGKDEDMPIGWRSRTLNDGSGAKTKRLGDIVNSTPIIVGRPDADYNFRYTDAEYRFFSSRYADRRQVVYVGANDGMLHAFNGGFYDAATKGFYTTSAAGTGSEVAHPLGSELWAYVPQSLLPHLQWLKEGDYPHVYYVDGDAQKFDVNIFDGCTDINTCKHPFGWGTILVVTMRLGGGEITFDPNSDDVAADVDGDDVTLKSSILIFDVTDPESEPELLAEISHDDLGFTTSTPALYKSRPRDTDGDFDAANSEWFIYVGTGARGTDGDTVSKQAALDSVVSSEPAKLMRINLKTMQIAEAPGGGSLEAGAFVSDISVMDWDNDYTDDAVYFGTVSGTVNAPTGSLFRYRPNYGTGTLDTILDSDQPYTAAPRPLLDRQNRRWVYAGTGRFFVANDILSATQQSFHGILEATDLEVSISPFNKTSLINTTDVEVFTTGEVEIADVSPINLTFTGGSGSTGDVETYSQLQQAIPDSGANGWYIDFPLYTGKGSSRNLLSPVLIRDVLVFDEYTASGQLCSPNGSSRLRNLNMITGTASPYVVFATDPSNVTQATTGGIEVLSGVGLGSGRIIGIAPHNDSIIVSEGGGENLEISTQVPTITNVPSGRRSWREIPLNL